MMPSPLVPVLAAWVVASGAVLWGLYRRRSTSAHVDLADLNFVAIDLETTGLDQRRDAIVAVAAIPFEGGSPRPEAGYVSLVDPGRPIPAGAQAIHGIRDADVQGAPSAAEALPRFLDVCRNRPIVAHTAAFDLAFINRFARADGQAPLRPVVLDVGALAHGLFPSWWDLSLEGLGRLLEVELVDRHTARGDALTAGLIFLRMVPLLERRGAGTLIGTLKLQRRAALLPGGPGATGGGLAGP
jgi:DNA polymerase III subunit epsilon